MKRVERIEGLASLPQTFRRPIDAYFRAFSELKADLMRSVSSRTLFLSSKSSIQQLERHRLKKEILVQEDKEQNMQTANQTFGESSDSVYASQAFFYGQAEILYRNVDTNRIVKRIEMPETRFAVSYISSLEPKKTGAMVHCQNCGAEIELKADEGHCPYCKSSYRFGDFYKLLNGFDFESYSKEKPMSVAVAFLPVLIPTLIALYLTDDFFVGLITFGISFVAWTVVVAMLLGFGLERFFKRTKSSDVGLNTMAMVTEGTQLFRACCESAPQELTQFLDTYVHPSGHAAFRKLHDVESWRMLDYLPKASRVDRIEETEDGQMLDLVLRAQEVRPAILGRLHVRHTTRRVRFWRPADAKTDRVEGVTLTSCPHCGSPVSLLERTHCPRCHTALPLDPNAWRLYDIS